MHHCDFVADHLPRSGANGDCIEPLTEHFPPLGRRYRQEAPIYGCLTGSLTRSLQFEGCSVYKNRTLHEHGIQERLQYEASILGVSDNSGQSLRRLVGLEFQAGLDSRPTASDRLLQDRSLLTNVRGYMHPGLVYFHLHHVPVPGNLGQQSERDGGAKVGQWWRRGIVSTHCLALVAGNGEALADEWNFYVRLLAHLFQGFGIYFENEFAGAHVGVQAHRRLCLGHDFLLWRESLLNICLDSATGLNVTIRRQQRTINTIGAARSARKNSQNRSRPDQFDSLMAPEPESLSREQAPFAGNAFEAVYTTVGKADA